jgi:hypothetical protein
MRTKHTAENAESGTAKALRKIMIHEYLAERMEKIASSRSEKANLSWWDVETHSENLFCITIETPKFVYASGLAVHDMLDSFIPFISVRKETDDRESTRVTTFWITTN